MALGPGIGGHAILNWALKYVQAPIVSVSVLGESVGASILAYFIFQEHLLWYQIVGGLLILAGIYTASVYQQS
jgi:drug/metabolite transporter (DMT)-like permease